MHEGYQTYRAPSRRAPIEKWDNKGSTFCQESMSLFFFRGGEEGEGGVIALEGRGFRGRSVMYLVSDHFKSKANFFEFLKFRTMILFMKKSHTASSLNDASCQMNE